MKQWQPSKIRHCKIKGLMPLFLCNIYRLGNNLPIYNNSIVPELLPEGGDLAFINLPLKTCILCMNIVETGGLHKTKTYHL